VSEKKGILFLSKYFYALTKKVFLKKQSQFLGKICHPTVGRSGADSVSTKGDEQGLLFFANFNGVRTSLLFASSSLFLPSFWL
jgi:hypothetical protein